MAINKVSAIELRKFNAASLTGGFDEFVDSLDYPCFLIRIINTSNVPVTISYDGIHHHDYVTTYGVLQLPFQGNNQPRGHVALLQKGQKVYLVGGAGIGYIYFAGYYNE